MPSQWDRPTLDICSRCCGENIPQRLREEDFVLTSGEDRRIPYHFESKDGRYDINVFWEPGEEAEMRISLWGQATGENPDFEKGYPLIIGQAQIRFPNADTTKKPWSAEYFLRRFLSHMRSGDYCLNKNIVPFDHPWPPPPVVGSRTEVRVDLDSGRPIVSSVFVR